MDMGLQEMIVRLSDYGVKFRSYNDTFVIEVQFDPDWTVIKPDSENIAFAKDDNIPGMCYYMCAKDSNLNDVFDAINNTIRHNEELKLKLDLFKKKVVELQDIFAYEPYEKLETLEFTFREQQKKKGRGRPPKQQPETVQETKPEEPVNAEKQKNVPKEEKESAGSNDKEEVKPSLPSDIPDDLDSVLEEKNKPHFIEPPKPPVKPEALPIPKPAGKDAPLSDIDIKIMNVMKNKKKKH